MSKIILSTDRHFYRQTDKLNYADRQTGHTDRGTSHTHRRHAKNNFFGLSGPQNVKIDQNLEIDFLGKCNTFSILCIVEKVIIIKEEGLRFLS